MRFGFRTLPSILRSFFKPPPELPIFIYLPRYFMRAFYFFLSVLAMFPMLSFSATSAPGVMRLEEDGGPGLWLDVSPALQEKCAPALQDFRIYFQKMTGKVLPEATGEGLIPLRLELLESEPTDQGFLGRGRAGDYSIDVSAQAIVVKGKTALALTNGLYGLLDLWGCRWVFPGELGEVVPKAVTLELPLGVTSQKIASDARLLAGPPSYYSEGEVGDWVRRNRFGKETTVTAHHHWCGIVPPTVYNDPSKPDRFHPEYFSLIGGKRVVGTDGDKMQICTTNPDVIRMAVESAKAYFREYPNVDNLEFCQCKTCLALDSGKLTSEGLRDVSDRVMTFVNEVARGIQDEFPDKLVGVYAYNNYTEPPGRVLPEKNVMVDITRMNYDLLRLMPRKEGDSSDKFTRLVEKWKALTPYIYNYEYNPIYWNAGLFCPNYLEFAEAIRFYRDKGVLGFRSDPGELPFRNRVNFVNDYLAMRVAVDASIEPKKELMDMCREFFGPGAEAMQKYYLTMAKVTEQDPVPGSFLGGGIRNFYRIFTPEMLAEATKDLAAARTAIKGEDPFRERLRVVEMGHRFLAYYLEGVWLAKGGNYEGALKAFSKMQRAIDALGSRNLFDNASGRAATMRAAALMALAEYCPEDAGFVRDWRILGPFDNSDRTAETTMAAFEPVTDGKSSVKGPDHKVVVWKNYQGPTGFLEFSKVFTDRPKDWSASTCYAGVRIVSDQPRTVVLECNSFNSFRIYLNGKEIFFRPGMQLDLPNGNRVNADLVAGENTLVFRCTESASSPQFPWGLYLRILNPADPEQTKIPGIRIVTK